MPPGDQHLVVAGPLQPIAGRHMLPQRLVQRERSRLAAEQRERALVGVHDEEVAVVNLVVELAEAVTLDEPVGADLAFPAVERLRGDRQHRLAARRRVPAAADDDGGLA